MSPNPAWNVNAACRGHHDKFFPEDPDHSGTWEEDSEHLCKTICSRCPVSQQCAADILSDLRGGTMPGVYAGMNRWERKWIIDNQERTVALGLELDKQKISTVELREWCVAVGPEDGITTVDTPRSVSDRFGYSESQCQRWLEMRGGTVAKRWVRPWSQAMREAVAADPDRWWNQIDLIEVGLEFIPQSNVETTRKSMIRARGACSERAAKSKILQRAVAAAVSSGVFEKRVIDGKVQIRGSRQPADKVTTNTKRQATLFSVPNQPMALQEKAA